MPEVSPNRGVMIVLAYLWPLALVPLLVERDDPDVQWHARHGIVLMIAEALLLVGYFVVAAVVRFAAFGLGGATLVFVVLAWIGVLALHVAAILKGISGQRLIVPRISSLVTER
ncbi:MAG TPA: hypothetical protein VGY57_09860 [Vicinamibacterales bacterium]|jgi:hypothetical protein|nr:hypothetical protein [Vicinamibacterales bacterium]